MKKVFTTLIMLAISSILAYSQDSTIKGIVTSSGDGEPLPGVSIVIKGTSNGTTTDIDGNFTLSVPVEGALVFSYIGFKTQEVSIGNQSVINVALESDVSQLEEIIVVGYGTSSKKDLTGAVATFDKEGVERSQATTVTQALQGRVSGVNIISNDGSPGGGVTVKIRGNGSLTSGSSPLFVIDGVQIPPSDDPDQNPFNSINPNDIESLEILKDASATSVYGSQGANGVVIITTKRGKGAPSLDVSYRMGLAETANKVNFLSAEEYARRSQFNAIRQNAIDGVSQTSIWDLIVRDEIWNDPRIQPWEDQLLQTAVEQQAYLSLGGGSDNTSYNVSVGYNDIDGIVKNSGYERLTSRLNITQDMFNKKLKIGLNVSTSSAKTLGLSRDGGNGGVFNRVLYTDPFLPVRANPQDFFDDINENPDLEPTESEREEASRDNPLNFLTELDVEKNESVNRGLLFMDLKLPIEGLGWYNGLATTNTDFEDKRFYSNNSNQARGVNGRILFQHDRGRFWTYESRLYYNKRINDNHRINVTAVFEAKKNDIKRSVSGTTDLVDDTQGIYSYSFGQAIDAGQGYSDLFDRNFSMNSYLGRATYAFKDRYLITGNYRLDYSSKFSNGNAGGNFGGLALGWVMSEESFMQNANWLDFLKIRGSYGIVGNDQVPSGLTLGIMNQDLIAAGDGEEAKVSRWPTQLPNPNLTWETVIQFNVGFDMNFFNERFDMTFDYFNKSTKDMLLNITLPGTTGFNEVWQNQGSLANRGLELGIHGDIVRAGDFKWRAGINGTLISTEIKDLGQGLYERFFNRRASDGTNDVRMVVGGGVGEWYGPVIDGVYNTWAEFLNSGVRVSESGDVSAINNEEIHTVDPNSFLGHPYFVDLDGDGIIDKTLRDKTTIAVTVPNFYGGFENTFSWKGFDLYGFFRWSAGNDIINSNIPKSTSVVSNDNIQTSAWNSAYKDDNPFGEYLASNYQGAAGWEKQTSSVFVESGSFFRLQTLQLGYTLSPDFASKLKMRSARIAVTTNNVFTITKYSWMDPEINAVQNNQDNTTVKVAPGLDNGVYPYQRNVQFSINLGF